MDNENCVPLFFELILPVRSLSLSWQQSAFHRP